MAGVRIFPRPTIFDKSAELRSCYSMNTARVLPFRGRRSGHKEGPEASSGGMDTQPTRTPSPSDLWTPRLQRVSEKRDRVAFAELFSHFAPLIKSFALSSPGMSSNALAEELVQEVMLKVWNRASTYDATKASATTWIYTLARNCRIDLLRKKFRLHEEVDVDEMWDLGTEEDVLEQDVSQQHLASTMREMMSNLPIEQRQIIGKVYMEGKSHSEVAEELDLPLGTVKSRVRLALGKLRVMLSE